MDSEQASGLGSISLTLGQKQEPSRLIVNWQRGMAIIWLANGTVIEANTPGQIDIQWPERRETPNGTD